MVKKWQTCFRTVIRYEQLCQSKLQQSSSCSHSSPSSLQTSPGDCFEPLICESTTNAFFTGLNWVFTTRSSFPTSAVPLSVFLQSKHSATIQIPFPSSQECHCGAQHSESCSHFSPSALQTSPGDCFGPLTCESTTIAFFFGLNWVLTTRFSFPIPALILSRKKCKNHSYLCS